MFAGVSSPMGFIDYFDHIMPLGKARKRYYLKGSSGSGKSTFIKRAAAALESAGFDTERFHCSNDAESLDAAAAAGRGLCILDATAPHSRDPQVPAAIDKIIDFAEFLDEHRLVKHTSQIQDLVRLKKILNDKAAGYFFALGKVFAADNTAYESALCRKSLDKLAEKWIKLLDLQEAPGRTGIDRKLFLNALTPDGPVSFAGDFFDGLTIYGLVAECGAGTNEFLSTLRNEANSLGLESESFYNPLAPDRIEYLILPGKAFVTVDGKFEYKGRTDELIDLKDCVDRKTLSRVKSENTESFENLLDKTVDLMRESKTVHSEIEEIYAHAMNFDKANNMTEILIKEILA